MPIRLTHALFLVLASSLAGGCATKSGDAPAAAASSQSHGLTRVEDPSLVCMVNDAFMGRPQIPVEVEGKTYYGCCAMCEGRLNAEPAVRMAADPVTGEPVDKATAVLAQDASGAILYFANEQNLRTYRPTP